MIDEWEQMCGGTWEEEHAAKYQGSTGADTVALASDRRQGAARTASPVADHRPGRSIPATRMTRRPYLDERDPAEAQEWREASSPGVRLLAKQATEAAVRRAKDSRVKPKESTDE